MNTSNNRERVLDLITKAHKASVTFQNALQEASAAALYYLVAFGNGSYMDKLYSGLNPSHAVLIRAAFVNAVHDKFGNGGVWDAAEKKWTKRPTPFVRFVATPK